MSTGVHCNKTAYSPDPKTAQGPAVEDGAATMRESLSMITQSHWWPRQSRTELPH